MKILNFISGWNWKGVPVRCGILIVGFLLNIQFIKAQEAEIKVKPDMTFLEFLGEGMDMEKEYIDPLQVHEYEKMMSDVQQEVKKQDD